MKGRKITPEKVQKYAHILSHVSIALFKISEVIHDTAYDIEKGNRVSSVSRDRRVIDEDPRKKQADKQDVLLERALNRKSKYDDEDDDEDEDFFANLDKMSKKKRGRNG